MSRTIQRSTPVLASMIIPLVFVIFLPGMRVPPGPVESAPLTLQGAGADYNLYSILLETRTDFAAGANSRDVFREYRGLADLGHLYHEATREGSTTVTRVFVGSYLGEPTGQRVLAEVQRRGYTSAELRVQKSAATNAASSNVLQIASIERRIDMRTFQKIRDQEGPGSVFAIIAPDDAFKILVGYQFSADQMQSLRTRLRNMDVASFTKRLSALY